jgi:CRP/FNR family transcriptional regulator, cyclic AMP receptor protein
VIICETVGKYQSGGNIVAENPLFDKYGQTVRDGTVIFEEGQQGDKMYIIQSGTVRITKKIDNREHQLAELAKGDFFGEMAIVSNIVRTASAVASGSVELLAFDRQGFEAMIGKNTKIAMNIIDKLSKRLQNANSQIQQLVRQNERSMIALNLYNRFLEQDKAEPVLTFDHTVEEIALELESPQTRVSEVLYEFDGAGICKIDGNAIRLRDKKRLVRLATMEG